MVKLEINAIIQGKKIPKEIPINFHNRSNYNYYFIENELAAELGKTIFCLGEKIQKEKKLYNCNRKRSYKN